MFHCWMRSVQGLLAVRNHQRKALRAAGKDWTTGVATAQVAQRPCRGDVSGRPFKGKVHLRFSRFSDGTLSGPSSSCDRPHTARRVKFGRHFVQIEIDRFNGFLQISIGF